MCTKNDVLDFIELQGIVEKEENNINVKRAKFEESISTEKELLELKKEKLVTKEEKIIEKLSSLRNKTIKAGNYTLSLVEKTILDVPKKGEPLRIRLVDWLRDNDYLASCSTPSISLIKRLAKTLDDLKLREKLLSFIPMKTTKTIKMEILP